MTNNYITHNNIVQYNDVISQELHNSSYYASILTDMVDSKHTIWNMDLPNIQSNKQHVILHTQDHLNVHPNNVLPELQIIEDFYKDEELSKIILIHWNHNLTNIYKGNITLIEFATHSFDFVQHLKNASNKWVDKIDNRTSNYDLICLNGKSREHRIKVCDYLTQHYQHVNKQITLAWKDSNEILSYVNYDYDNAGNFIKLLDYYRGANVNVVNETLYDNGYGIITEKTLMAFAAMQLPIVIGYKGIIRDLRHYGFDVFDDVIDHSYDDLPDDIRWKQAIKLNEHVLLNEFKYTDLTVRLKANQDYLLNGYLTFIIAKFKTQIIDMNLKNH